MQPASHPCSPGRTTPLHKQHSHCQRPIFMTSTQALQNQHHIASLILVEFHV